MQTGSSVISRAPRPSSLADVLDLILDKGLVIDAYVRVSLAGIELLTVDARIVVASVDTYLRFAEAVNRLDLTQTEQQGLPALFGSNGKDADTSSNRQRGEHQGNRRGRDGSSKDDGRPGERRTRALGRGTGDGSDQADDADGGEEEEAGLLERIAERARFQR